MNDTVISMKLDVILFGILFVLGLLVAIGPWTFVPVCVTPMRCWDTRTFETIAGAAVAILSIIGVFKGLE